MIDSFKVYVESSNDSRFKAGETYSIVEGFMIAACGVPLQDVTIESLLEISGVNLEVISIKQAGQLFINKNFLLSKIDTLSSKNDDDI